MSETIINGIDVSEYFIDVVDEGGSTIDYEILPNSKRLLVEKIFEQNQQLKRLQEENKRLQMLSCVNCGEKYLSPDGAELYEKNVQLQEENEGLKTYIQKMDKPEIKTIDSEIALKNIELQQENEKIKNQYNCYACGNCNGKEDYINLEKHHKGLRKQFDEVVKRNNTLSLRIEELEKENEGLKNTPRLELDTSYIREKELECIKYRQALEEIREVINCSDKDDCDNCPRNDFCEELCDSKENLIYVLKTMI